MNGIVITSLEGGLLLYERSYVPNYGLSEAEVNAFQLSSSLFAVFRIAQGENNESSGLKWIQKDNSRILFVDCGQNLVTVFIEAGLSDLVSLLVIEKIKDCLERNAGIIENPMKPASKKVLRAELLTLQMSISALLLKNLQLHSSIENLFVAELEPPCSFNDWLDQQWDNSPVSATPTINPSSKSLGVALDNSSSSSSANKTTQVVSSSSEKILPPLLSSGKPPVRSNSFSQLFRRLMPRFDNRAASPSAVPLTSTSEGIAATRETGYRVFCATCNSTVPAFLPITRLLLVLSKHLADSNRVPSSTNIDINEPLSVSLMSIHDAEGYSVEFKEMFGGVKNTISDGSSLREWTIHINSSDESRASIGGARYLIHKIGAILVALVIPTSGEDNALIIQHREGLVDLMVWSRGLLRNGCERRLLV